MIISGNYPFTVRFLNSFDPALGISLQVARYQHKSYFKKKENSQDPILYVIEDLAREEELYTIEGGMSLAFPMYYGDDRLVLSIDGTPPDKYKISAGGKAKIYRGGLLENMEPEEGTHLGKEKDDYGDFYRGGTWNILPDPNGWTLEIRKYGPDPQDEDVTVGPATPG